MPSEIHTASCRDDRSHLRRNMQPPVYRRMGSFGCTVFPSGLFGQALTVKGETEGFDIFDFKLRSNPWNERESRIPISFPILKPAF